MQAIGKAKFLQPSVPPIRGSKNKIIFDLRSFQSYASLCWFQSTFVYFKADPSQFPRASEKLEDRGVRVWGGLLKVWLLWGFASKCNFFLKGAASPFKWAVRLESWLLQCLVISEDQWRRYKGTTICFGWVELLLSLSSATIDATRSKQLCDPNQSVKRHNIYSKA
jgi:hypothetical protein